MKENRFSTQSLVMMAMFAAILCVSAYITIALPNGSHITFFNFVYTLITLMLPSQQCFLIILVWFLLGAAGIPILVGGQSGIGYLLSPWGGYNFAFLAAAIFIPMICGQKYNRIRYTAAALISVTFVDLVGTIWLMALSGISPSQAFLSGFVTFIPLDIVKAVIAAQVAPVFRRTLQQTRSISKSS